MVGGDGSGGTATSALYVYNPTSGSWSAGQNMQDARSDFAVVLADDGYIYAMGGSTNSVERIDTNASGQSPIAVDDDDVSEVGHAENITVSRKDRGRERVHR